MLKFDVSSLNALSNEVIVQVFDMLCVCVEHQVPIQVNNAHVVAVKGSQILDGNVVVKKTVPERNRCTRARGPALLARTFFVVYNRELST